LEFFAQCIIYYFHEERGLNQNSSILKSSLFVGQATASLASFSHILSGVVASHTQLCAMPAFFIVASRAGLDFHVMHDENARTLLMCSDLILRKVKAAKPLSPLRLWTS
jgi:hypothetical protein